MGRKSKRQGTSAPGGKSDPKNETGGYSEQEKKKGAPGHGQQKQEPQQSGGQQERQQRGQPRQQQQSSQQPSQQGAWGGGQQQRPSQQGAWGGGQQQQPSQEGAWGGGQQQRPSQQGAWGGGQQRQPSQQGAWGGGQQQRPSQQGAWGGGQQRQPSQQGAWGGGQQQRPSQQGAWGGGQQQQPSQEGAWGGGQQQRPSQQGAWGGGQQRQPSQQGARGDVRQQQHRERPHQQQAPQQDPSVSRQQQRQQWGQPSQHQEESQQGAWGGSQLEKQRQQQRQRQHPSQAQQGQKIPLKEMAEILMSDKAPLPNKQISCSGIVRGSLGEPDVVEVNYLKLDLSNMPKEAYHYDVTINPDRPKKFLRPVFEQCRLEVFPNIPAAFDGMRNCYSLNSLPVPIDRKVEITDSNNRMKEFQIQIKQTDTCVVNLDTLKTYQSERVFDKPMRALQVLEVVLTSSNHSRGIRVGRSFFRKPFKPYNLEGGFEAWTGLFQAPILGEQPFLNVDISHKSFPCEGTIIEYLRNQNINIANYIDRKDFQIIRSYLKGMSITYTPPECFGALPKQYKILDIGEPPESTKFKTDDGKEHTVEDYFNSRGYKLQYPKLNCIKVGSSVRQIALPMELCSIPGGQALNRKDKDRQVANMIRFAATSTNARKIKIMELLSYFNHNDNDIIRAFGLTIGSDFIKVPMRLLPKPVIEYFGGRIVVPSNGNWRMEDGMKFLITSKPPNGHKWAILSEESKCRTSHHNIEDFKATVIKTSESLNINLQNRADILRYNFRDLPLMFKKLVAEKYDLAFVILSDFGTPYSKIKQTAELEVGLLTQCIKERTLLRTLKDRSIFSNILLKINGKLNGTNHKIAIDTDSNLKALLAPIDNVMYIGADVTHPSPDQHYIPSVVGVAASHDRYGACYNCQYRLQTAKNETIEDMESIVTKHLETYYNYQKKYPNKIIYYRDGVSDGQFPQIKKEEVRCIKNACRKKNCNPKLTCIIVVKRHHTRFFPPKQPFSIKDFNNIPPGGVVDQHITHPNEVQFFMVSHQCIQGTAKPTRYNVIVDESNFDINLLQKLTYNLCHLFPRCNRSVSYPAPAYLAHLVAYRGRVYIEGTFKFDKNLKKEYDKRLIKPEFMNKSPMYFI